MPPSSSPLRSSVHLGGTTVGLFGSKDSKAQIEEWRGRSRELPDAGSLSWKVVWESLLVEPGVSPGGAMDPIGLRGVHVPRKGDTTTAYQGTRHERTVHVRSGQLKGRGGVASAVWVGVATPNFSSTASAGHLQTKGSIPELQEHLATFAAAPDVWTNVSVYGGPDGILVSRLIDNRNPQAWVYDVWLAERVADICAVSPLPAPGDGYWELPYGVPSAAWTALI